jgi:hypothetical protein
MKTKITQAKITTNKELGSILTRLNDIDDRLKKIEFIICGGKAC